MNLDDALALLTRANSEIARSRQRGISATYIATFDGADFFLLYAKDNYDDGVNIIEATSAEEWNRRNIGWRQHTLNRDGGWSRRRVVFIEHGNVSHPSRVPPTRWTLNCGHRISGFFDYAEPEGPVEDGSRVACIQCRDAGCGLDVPDPMEVEGVTA